MRQLPQSPPGSSESLSTAIVRRENGAPSASYNDGGYFSAPDPDAQPESGGVLEYWRILRRRKGTLVLIAGVGAIIGFLVTLPQTPSKLAGYIRPCFVPLNLAMSLPVPSNPASLLGWR